MGQFLYMGLWYKVEILQSSISYYKLAEADVLSELAKKLDLTIYNREDTNESLVFRLKDELLENELISFLATQFSFFEQSPDNQKNYQDTIMAIKKQKTATEIISLAESRSLRYFQQYDFMDEIQVGEWRRYLSLQISNLIFEIVGKTFIEEYYDFLVYLVNLIRKAAEGNPLSGAVAVAID